MLLWLLLHLPWKVLRPLRVGAAVRTERLAIQGWVGQTAPTMLPVPTVVCEKNGGTKLTSIKNSGSAKPRIRASLLATPLIGCPCLWRQANAVDQILESRVGVEGLQCDI
jgi:hypothetical protein